MRKISDIRYIILLTLCGIFAAGCSEPNFEYSGPPVVMFADSIQTYPVWEKADDPFNVVIGTVKPFSSDRWIAVEVVDAESTAVEGVDFVLEQHNALMAKGEFTSTVSLKADFDRIEDNNDKYVTLRLVAEDDVLGGNYNIKTRIILRKATVWTMDDLVEDGGHWLIYEYVSGGTYRHIKAEKVDENRIRFKNYIGTGRDVVVRITDQGEFYAKEAEVLPQYLINLDEYGPAYVASVTSNPSYYLPSQRAMQLFLDIYVEGVGSFSVYPFLMAWCSAEEAEYLVKEQLVTDNYID